VNRIFHGALRRFPFVFLVIGGMVARRADRRINFDYAKQISLMQCAMRGR
jgi:hypothetical protein